MTVFEKIEAQQKGKENTAVWMVGEQLKDICRADPHCAELVAQDLENSTMSIANCEKKLKAWADSQAKRTRAEGACVPPNVSDKIIREFYGLPENSRGATPVLRLIPQTEADAETVHLNLADIL